MYRSAPARLAYRSTLRGVDAFESSTGQTVWSWATHLVGNPGGVPVRVEIRDGCVYFLGMLQQGPGRLRALVCLDAQTGNVRWLFNLEPLYPASTKQILLAFEGDVVLVTSLGPHANTAGIARLDGRGLWARQEPMAEPPVLSVDGESAYYDRSGFEV